MKSNTKSNTKCVYTFEQGTGLVASFQNSINYANIKNDYSTSQEDAYSCNYINDMITPDKINKNIKISDSDISLNNLMNTMLTLNNNFKIQGFSPSSNDNRTVVTQILDNANSNVSTSGVLFTYGAKSSGSGSIVMSITIKQAEGALMTICIISSNTMYFGRLYNGAYTVNQVTSATI